MSGVYHSSITLKQATLILNGTLEEVLLRDKDSKVVFKFSKDSIFIYDNSDCYKRSIVNRYEDFSKLPSLHSDNMLRITMFLRRLLNELGFFRAIEIKVNDKFNLYDLVMSNTN